VDRKQCGALVCWCVIVLYFVLFLTRSVSSAEPPARQPIPPDWVGWALTDLVQQPEADRPFIRYLASPPWGDERWVPLVNFALNSSVSQATIGGTGDHP
jgi:hypothetical protein